ncbi:MAG: LPS export ABC transporter periplasmic protein LptC [Saprospiraceae bacterium]|nr:LPS export ABC transporter periplasmic protein LptC [Saprospiraceae bacterium]
MRMLTVIGIMGVLSMAACIEKEIDFETLRAKRDFSTEIASDVLIHYSDSAQLRVRIEGPVLKRYLYRFRIEEEFPDGVSVEFYDRSGRPNAWLEADYAMRRPNEKVVVARGNVILWNEAGERLETHELTWSESEQTLTTERLVKITRPPDEVIWSRGFRTNQSFTEYELFAVEGQMVIRDDNEKPIQ